MAFKQRPVAIGTWITFHHNNARPEEREFVDTLHCLFSKPMSGAEFVTEFKSCLVAHGERESSIEQHITGPHGLALRQTWDEHPMNADDATTFRRRLNRCFGPSVPGRMVSGVWARMFESLDLPWLPRFYCRDVANRPYAYLRHRCRRYRAWHRLYCLVRLQLIRTWQQMRRAQSPRNQVDELQQLMRGLNMTPRRPMNPATRQSRCKWKRPSSSRNLDS